MTVDFLLIGSAKSATTSLSSAISQHPDICFSNPKEPQFFDKPDWRTKLDQYHSLFNSTAKLYGEGSTNYSKFPDYNKNIHQDIYEYNSNMKFIYIMRNPVDRMVSHYIHAYNRGHESISDFNEAVIINKHYINTGKYAMQIEPYIERFGRLNVLLLFFEDFISNPQSTTDQVFNFLNLETIDLDTKKLNINKSFNRRVLHYKYDNPKTLLDKLFKSILIVKNYLNSDFIDTKPLVSASTKAFILNSCKDDIHRIEALTNRDLKHWLD